jgi:hypothetical protein
MGGSYRTPPTSGTAITKIPPSPLGGGGQEKLAENKRKVKKSKLPRVGKTNSPMFAKVDEYRKNICIFVNKMCPKKCEVDDQST